MLIRHVYNIDTQLYSSVAAFKYTRMILFYLLTIVVCVNGGILPLSDLLPPSFDDATSSVSGTEESARLRGLYVPDNLEKRFDDGSDKSPPAPVPIVNSPFGPVPAGSGFEGQYVDTHLEKRFDDGSDKSPPAPVPKTNSPFGLVSAGSGLEGQYVDAHLEQRFDDGSDKSPPAPVPIVNSPFGPAPAGSGLEGQYVDTHLDKQFDDGLYRGEVSPEPNLIDSSFESGIEGHQYFGKGLVISEATSSMVVDAGVPQGLVPPVSGPVPFK